MEQRKETALKLGHMSVEEAKMAVSSKPTMLDIPTNPKAPYLLHLAARVGNLPLVKFILSSKPEQLNARRELSEADVLQHAVVSGNLELVKWLLGEGADCRRRYFNDTSLLYYAAKYKHLHIFRYFVEDHGFDSHEILATNGVQALYIAMENNDKELFDYVLSSKPYIENIGPYNYLAFAARLEDAYWLERLLDHNAPFDPVEIYNRSAFSWAGEDNRHRQMELLLKRAKGVKPEPLSLSHISQISHIYNSLCSKWWRLYDVYMLRYFCEVQRREIDSTNVAPNFLQDPALNSLYSVVTTVKRKPETLLFKVPRNIFRNVMKYLHEVPVALRPPKPYT